VGETSQPDIKIGGTLSAGRPSLGHLYDIAIVLGDYFIGRHIGGMIYSLMHADKAGPTKDGLILVIFATSILTFFLGLIINYKPIKYLPKEYLTEGDKAAIFIFSIVLGIAAAVFVVTRPSFGDGAKILSPFLSSVVWFFGGALCIAVIIGVGLAIAGKGLKDLKPDKDDDSNIHIYAILFVVIIFGGIAAVIGYHNAKDTNPTGDVMLAFYITAVFIIVFGGLFVLTRLVTSGIGTLSQNEMPKKVGVLRLISALLTLPLTICIISPIDALMIDFGISHDKYLNGYTEKFAAIVVRAIFFTIASLMIVYTPRKLGGLAFRNRLTGWQFFSGMFISNFIRILSS